MDSLVLLILGAVWASVLLPPLLQNRIENRPNSSVTDFRRQLNKLQSTVPSRASGSVRMARPLAQSPLQRPAVGGRSGHGRGAQTRRAAPRAAARQHGTQRPVKEDGNTMVRNESAPRQRRSHGDPSGGQRHPQQRRPQQRRPQQRRMTAQRVQTTSGEARRRRTNVLWLMVGMVGVTLLLAATTKEPAMMYVFSIAFLALCGYLFLLSQANRREASQWGNDWMS